MSDVYLLRTGNLPGKDFMRMSASELKESKVLTSCIVNISELEFHLQLNSIQIDKLVVELVDTEEIESLLLLAEKAKKVLIVMEQKEVTMKLVKLLCDMFPEKAAKIRSAAMTRKSIQEVLDGE